MEGMKNMKVGIACKISFMFSMLFMVKLN